MSGPRVLHLIHHLHIGGAETLLAELLPCLAQAGFDVQVGCLDSRGPLFDVLRERGVPAHFIGRRRGFDYAALRRLSVLLRALRVDILNTHSFSAGFWGRIAAIPARTPGVVTTVHTVAGWSQPLKQRLGNRLLQARTDSIVAVSESVRRSLADQGAPARLLRVIHNGVNIERFGRAGSPAVSRKRLGFRADVPLIGMIGRCSPEKGGARWVRAMAALARTCPDVGGVLIGDGPERPAWQALAAESGLSGRIRFVGEQHDVAPWLSCLTVLVCPSLQESFGVVALEAQAAGVPVVAARADGFAEMLHHGQDALLVRAGDPAAVAEAVRALLESDALRRRLTAAGRSNAARFTIERTAEQYGALYRELQAAGERLCRRR